MHLANELGIWRNIRTSLQTSAEMRLKFTPAAADLWATLKA